MKPLLEIVEVKQIKERRFYVVLWGRRNEQKRIILSKCLLLCALKWRNQSKKDFGKQLQPDMWATMLRTLFSIFKSKESYSSIPETLTTMESFMLFFKSSGKKKLNICNRNTNIKARLRSRSKN